jgi:hypothetical protein
VSCKNIVLSFLLSQTLALWEKKNHFKQNRMFEKYCLFKRKYLEHVKNKVHFVCASESEEVM